MRSINLVKTFILTLFMLACFNYSVTAQVGIGTTDPKTTLDVSGSVSLREGTALALSNGANNDISLGATTHSFYRITGPTNSYSISGIVPETGADGQTLTIENTVDSDLILIHDATSTAANRIYCPGEKDFLITGRFATVTLQYNKTQSRWVIINYANNHYGNNIQSVILPTGTQNVTGSTHTDITGATITFTPRHSTVYLSFTISGYNPLTGGSGGDQLSWFSVRVINGSTNTGNFVSISAASDDISGAVGASTITAANYPLTVTPNVPVTIKLQGTNGGVEFSSGFTIDRTNYTSFMTILD